MPNNLARFERLAQAAKMRAALAREHQLNPHERYAQEMAEMYARAAEYRRELEAQGPPDGCHECWQIREAWPWNGCSWKWGHGDLIDPEERVVESEGDLDPVEFCTHTCHGPAGWWAPIVVYA